jgi:hypothetical protein
MKITVDHRAADRSYKFAWEDLEPSYKDDIWEERIVEIGDTIVSRVRGKAGWTAEETFAGLPDNMCTCPHFGMVLRGKVRIVTKEGHIDCEAGDAYYQAVPHRVEWLEDSELIEFSPREPFWQVTEVALRNKDGGQDGDKK